METDLSRRMDYGVIMCQISREIIHYRWSISRATGTVARSKGNQLDFLKRATRKSREQTRPARARLALLCPTPSKQQPVGLSNARTALKPEPPIDTRRFFCTSKSCCTGSIIGSIQNHWDLFCLLRLRIPTLVEAHCTAISSLPTLFLFSS